jgi:hypothetical protein
MSIRQVIDWAIDSASGVLYGTIASDFYQVYSGEGETGPIWSWACDVDIGEEETLTGVLIASNNAELIYAEQGKGVTLQKSLTGTYTITGFTKKTIGYYHYTYVSFAEDVTTIVRDEYKGFKYRRLTLGEIGTLAPFGTFPLQPRGKFKADNTFMGLV